MKNKLFICIILLSASLQAYAHPDELLYALSGMEQQSSYSSINKSIGSPLWEINAKVPFIGSPVHEKMTSATITLSGIYHRPYDQEKDSAYIHGVFWNDDPDDLLCPECSISNLRKFDQRWGVAFATRFTGAKKHVKNTAQDKCEVAFKVGDGMLERSHFGDLQFLHAMASCNGESAKETQSKIMAWAEFVYKVSIGEIRQKTKMDQIPIDSIRNLFLKDNRIAQLTIEEFFKGNEFARRVAMGSLLHMVQDSYAPGHVDREVLDYHSGTGRIFARGGIWGFHCYSGQDETLHAQDDKWPDGLNKSVPVGYENPIAIGANLLVKMNTRTPWIEVEKYLKTTVFAIKDPSVLAGPGDKYRKK